MGYPYTSKAYNYNYFPLFYMKKVTTIVFALLLSYLFLVPQIFGGINAQVCDDNSPNGKPILVSAVAGTNSVTLTWTEGQDPITHYLVAYGRSETEIEFGNPNIGGKGTTTYTVGGLSPGVKYYFKIRPVNGCRTGDFSNKLSAIPGLSRSKSFSAPRTPNLSIYKTNMGASPSATPSPEPETATNTAAVANNKLKCTGCISWPLLGLEAALLVMYFHFAKKHKFLKQIFSIAIPGVMYILFWNMNQSCSLKAFTCKYFAPLEVITFISILIWHKNQHK